MRIGALPLTLTALLVTVAGCGLSVGGPATGSFRTPDSRNAPEAALQQFYDQQLEWRQCGDNQCAKLTVPMDYANPTAGTVQLAVLKVPSTGNGRNGTLVVNPGGPGGSGVEYAQAADRVLTPDLLKAYDIVGFDPRGVGASDPLKCLTGAQLDQFLATDGSPDTPAETAAIDSESRDLGARCQAADATLAANIGSTSVVKDMDILRAALDQPQLNYLGFSYGTYLGALYADEFVGQRIQPFWIEDEAAKLDDTNFIVQGRFRPHAVRDGNLITGQQQYSGAAAARLVAAGLIGTPAPVILIMQRRNMSLWHAQMSYLLSPSNTLYPIP